MADGSSNACEKSTMAAASRPSRGGSRAACSQVLDLRLSRSATSGARRFGSSFAAGGMYFANRRSVWFGSANSRPWAVKAVGDSVADKSRQAESFVSSAGGMGGRVSNERFIHRVGEIHFDSDFTHLNRVIGRRTSMARTPLLHSTLCKTASSGVDSHLASGITHLRRLCPASCPIRRSLEGRQVKRTMSLGRRPPEEP